MEFSYSIGSFHDMNLLFKYSFLGARFIALKLFYCHVGGCHIRENHFDTITRRWHGVGGSIATISHYELSKSNQLGWDFRNLSYVINIICLYIYLWNL